MEREANKTASEVARTGRAHGQELNSNRQSGGEASGALVPLIDDDEIKKR